MLDLVEVYRAFGTRLALDNVTFSVAPGRLTGFVGGNGAGKTTAMRIIMGVLKPDQGTVNLDGRPVSHEAAQAFGYMPEERGLYPKMPVGEQLVYLARLHGLDKSHAQRNAASLLERLGLAARAKDPVEALSLGNQQRAQIAAALVHEPTVLILDEPFSGLDPLAVDVVLGVLSEFAAGGAPVLFSSHQLDVVERITDDLVIIASGQIKASGSRAALQERYAGTRHRLLSVCADPAWLASLPGVAAVAEDGSALTFEADDAAAQAVLKAALARGPVEEFGRRRPSLAEVFKEVIRDEAPEEVAA